MRLRSFLLSFLVSAAFVGAAPAAGESPDPRGLLQEAMQKMALLDAFSVETMARLHMRSGEQEQEVSSEASLIMAGTDQIILRTRSEDERMELYSDGEALFLHLVDEKRYVRQQAPASRDRMVALIFGGAVEMMPDWLPAFFRNERGILEYAEDIRYLGETSAPAPAHQIRLQYENYHADVFLAVDTLLLRELHYDLSQSLQGARAQVEGREQSLVAELKLTAWQLNPVLEAGHFTFQPAEGVERLDPRSPQDPMIGRPAPDFSVDLLDGGRVELAQHRGREVVILDFWATWCGPCRVGLPMVAEVVEEFADQGVVFYAVNIRESVDRIQPFLDSLGVPMKVALDTDGTMARDYRASGIPRTVVVDKEGIVQAVHAGVSPALRTQLQRELTEILAEN